MRLHRSYEFKMEPDFQQTEQLYQFAGCRRFVYNWALGRRKKFYKETEKTISAKQLSTELTALKSVNHAKLSAKPKAPHSSAMLAAIGSSR